MAARPISVILLDRAGEMAPDPKHALKVAAQMRSAGSAANDQTLMHEASALERWAQQQEKRERVPGDVSAPKGSAKSGAGTAGRSKKSTSGKAASGKSARRRPAATGKAGKRAGKVASRKGKRALRAIGDAAGTRPMAETAWSLFGAVVVLIVVYLLVSRADRVTVVARMGRTAAQGLIYPPGVRGAAAPATKPRRTNVAAVNRSPAPRNVQLST